MKIEYNKKFNVFTYSKEDKRFYFFMLIGKDFMTFDIEKIKKNKKILTRYRIMEDYDIKKTFIKRIDILDGVVKNKIKKYEK